MGFHMFPIGTGMLVHLPRACSSPNVVVDGKKQRETLEMTCRHCRHCSCLCQAPCTHIVSTYLPAASERHRELLDATKNMRRCFLVIKTAYSLHTLPTSYEV